jgi:O-antigen/teichoic acid export membrane protein
MMGKINIKNFGSLFIYCVGMLSMFLIDIVISTNFSIDEVARWALIKSIVFISVPITLLGLDHALVRSPGLIKAVSKIIFPQITLIAASILIVVHFIGVESYSFKILIIIVSMSLVSYFFALYRATYCLTRAQYILNGWKILFLGAVIYISYGDDNISFNIVDIFQVSIVLSLILIIFDSKNIKMILFSSYKDDHEKDIFELFKVGFKFSITMILLNVSLYLEQVLLNYNSSVDSAIYFTHMVSIMSPIVLFNGYINFYLGPYVRRNMKHIFHNFRTKFAYFILFSIIISMLGYIAGAMLFDYLYTDKYEFNVVLSLIILIIAFVRTLFIIPSSFIAVLGSNDQLARYVKYNATGLMVFLLIYVVGRRYEFNVLYVVALGVLCNWLVRVINGYIILISIYNNRRVVLT